MLILPKYITQMKIRLGKLIDLVEKSLIHQGYSGNEVKTISQILLYAQLRGNNQGVVKLIGKGIPKNIEAIEPKVIKETAISALYDGGMTHAMIVMDIVTQAAINKAKKSGIGIVGNFNTAESTGALGYYVNKIAQEGLIGIAYASAPFKTTAPYGSNEALFCTNPMAYGIPTQGEPIILDMTTSAMSYYGLIEAKTAQKSVPDNTGYDKNGKLTLNPAEIMAGALKTFGEHRGSGLALVVQIFAAALVQADSFDNDSNNAGNLVFAIDPEILTSKQQFTSKVSTIINKVKSARKLDGITEILIPGERGNTLRNMIDKSGELEIEENLYNALTEISVRSRQNP
jgi:LDH2 family malate/lactate/ureidoglycolate dehydrogenase